MHFDMLSINRRPFCLIFNVSAFQIPIPDQVNILHANGQAGCQAIDMHSVDYKIKHSNKITLAVSDFVWHFADTAPWHDISVGIPRHLSTF